MSEVGSVKRKALVIGCGIAGPAVAIALRRAGLEAAVYEAWPTPEHLAGGWLTVMPNGVDVVRTLGADAALRDGALRCERIDFRDHGNRPLGVLALPGAVSVRRGHLHRVLREHASELGIEITFGKRLLDVEDSGTGVVAHFEDGTSAEGDLLVGADGLRSRVREAVLPEAPPFEYIGAFSTVGFCQLDTAREPKDSLQVSFGRRTGLRHIIRPGGEVFWACDTLVPPDPDTGLPPVPPDENAWRELLVASFAGDAFPAVEYIQATETLLRQPIYRLGALHTWYHGRVCLVGDAAHAIPPYAGQGASMALEDAITLAKCLRDVPDVTAAFATYEQIRKPRQARVTEVTRNNGRTVVAKGAVGRWIRNRMIATNVRNSQRSVTWLSGHRIDWDDAVAVTA